MINDNTFDDENLEISKSQVKREMIALQHLGKKLTELKPAQLKKMPISEELLKAVQESYNIQQREAKRRHLNYIGRLMRSEDPEKVQYALDEFDSSSLRYAQEIHLIEVWRERLIAGDKTSLTAFIEEKPEANAQLLRQLIRNAQKDLSQEKNTGAAKKLFQFIRALYAN
ncbi:MAG: ribosome-associated protein [Pseudohongiellaceae bacterium]|jgi:ribosome-associated protein